MIERDVRRVSHEIVSLLLFKKSTLQGWEKVDALYQSEDLNHTKSTHKRKEEKEKTAKDEKGESSSG